MSDKDKFSVNYSDRSNHYQEFSNDINMLPVSNNPSSREERHEKMRTNRSTSKRKLEIDLEEL